MNAVAVAAAIDECKLTRMSKNIQGQLSSHVALAVHSSQKNEFRLVDALLPRRFCGGGRGHPN